MLSLQSTTNTFVFQIQKLSATFIYDSFVTSEILLHIHFLKVGYVIFLF